MNAPQFLYRVRPRRTAMLTDGPTDSEAATMKDHLRYLERLADDGVVLLAGRTQTADQDTFGIVILTADSDEIAARIMAGDPAVERGLMDAELFPYSIAVLSEAITKPD